MRSEENRQDLRKLQAQRWEEKGGQKGRRRGELERGVELEGTVKMGKGQRWRARKEVC